jgi:alcohol dehydrogenase YqhD (iron-dependent ADH family)
MCKDIEQHRKRAIKVLHVCNLIAEAKSKRNHIKSSYYYKIFGTSQEQQNDLERIDQVINRLINYFNKMK